MNTAKEEVEEAQEPGVGGTSEEMQTAASEFLRAMQPRKKYGKKETEKKNLISVLTLLFAGDKK